MDKLKIKKNGQFIQIPLSAFDNDTNFIDNTYHDNTKVDKEIGKGLSTNDYTNEEKAKLGSLYIHYSNVTTANTIKTYLDSFNGNGDYRITSNLDKEIYIFSGYYYNVSINGVMQYRRSQRYYSISEPWKIYSRFGLYDTSTKKINWNAWHVVEGVEE